MSNKLIIAVDGPSSSGKGTIAKMIASHFQIPYLNTGALYRQLAYDSLELGLNLEKDDDKIIQLVSKMDLLDLESSKIHNEEIGKFASIIAKSEKIRSALRYLQKDFACGDLGAVLDGRDIGTVICPDANYKFFITASLETRTQRRYLQLSKLNPNTSKEVIFNQLQERDFRDKTRKSSPLLIAQDAVEIDTSDLSIKQVFEIILNFIK
jgi:cytidylate kinase